MKSTRENYQNNDAITWTQTHNLLPILAMILTGVGIFNVLSNRVELLSQRVGYVETTANTCQQSLKDLQNGRTMQQSLLTPLDLQRGVQGASTSSGKVLTPTPTLTITKVATPSPKGEEK